jgi:hypothetical protein
MRETTFFEPKAGRQVRFRKGDETVTELEGTDFIKTSTFGRPSWSE